MLWGAAALHGSMTDLTARAADVERPLTTRRLAALAGATLIADLVHAVHDAASGVLAEPVLYAVSIVIFLLVVLRLAGLVQREERSARREKTLREAGASLVAAADRGGVYVATIEAAAKLAGPDSSVGVLSWAGGSTRPELPVARGEMAGFLVGLWPDSPALREELLAEGSVIAAFTEAFPESVDSSSAVTVRLPLLVGDELRVLAVVSPRRPPAAVIAGLKALSAQAGLALESAELAEALAQQRSQEWFASLVQNASDVILVIEPDTTIRFVSPASNRVLGYRPDQI